MELTKKEGRSGGGRFELLGDLARRLGEWTLTLVDVLEVWNLEDEVVHMWTLRAKPDEMGHGVKKA